MSNQAIMALGAGALGFFAGKSSVPVAEDSGDTLALQNQVSNLLQQTDLLRTQLAATDALKDLATSTGTAAQAATAVLQAQIASLQQQLAQSSANTAVSFPIAFGPGDPSLAGWIKGRNGLLISRVLGNLVPTGLKIGTIGGTTGNPAYSASSSSAIASALTVADIYQSLPPRLVTLGKNVSTHLLVEMPTFVGLNTAVLFNFADDVAEDPDFLAYAAVSGVNQVHATAFPVGRNSIMVVPKDFIASYSTVTWANMRERMVNGTIPGEAMTASWLATQVHRISLTHRSARALTLKSVNVVANPLMVANETETGIYLEDSASNGGRLRNGAAKLLRMHAGLTPTFYRVGDVTKELETVDVSAAAYA